MMVAKDSYQESVEEENPNPNPNMQEIDEAEDTLSLCDLPIYSDAADWEDFSKEDQSSFSSSEQDYFEFSSEEWCSSTTTSCPPENIVFCGKLIPYKKLVVPDETQKQKSNKQPSQKRRGLFRWNSDSFYKPKTTSRSSVSSSKSMPLPVSEKHGKNTGKWGDKYDFSVRRVSMLTSQTKSRWYLFMFGLARFPTEMELRDIRNRQSRKSRSMTLFRTDDGGGEKEAVCRKRGKGLWGLIKALGCGGHHHANAVAQAPFGCIPPL